MKGEAIGRKVGKEEGEVISKKNIAKKLKEMNMKMEDIVKATGLTKEEIEQL